MKLIIDIPEGLFEAYKGRPPRLGDEGMDMIAQAIANGTPLPETYGRLGDLDELEQRISNFIEHDAHMQDEYTLIRERFILDGIKDTHTIIEANMEAENES